VTAARAPLPAERRKRRIAKKDRVRFLEALAAGWAVRHAAELAGVDRRRFYELRAKDPGFADDWSEAVEQGTQRLEDEATRRAVEGFDELTYDGKGELIRRVRRYDGALLQTLLKGRRPEVYRDGASLRHNPTATRSVALPGKGATGDNLGPLGFRFRHSEIRLLGKGVRLRRRHTKHPLLPPAWSPAPPALAPVAQALGPAQGSTSQAPSTSK
jgi:hypothetical protein